MSIQPWLNFRSLLNLNNRLFKDLEKLDNKQSKQRIQLFKNLRNHHDKLGEEQLSTPIKIASLQQTIRRKTKICVSQLIEIDDY